jgi:hypothetical protein
MEPLLWEWGAEEAEDDGSGGVSGVDVIESPEDMVGAGVGGGRGEGDDSSAAITTTSTSTGPAIISRAVLH